MKAYILTTGLIFVLVIAAHVARLFAEGLHPLTQPIFVFTTLLAIALSLWAWHLFRKPSKPDEKP